MIAPDFFVRYALPAGFTANHSVVFIKFSLRFVRFFYIIPTSMLPIQLKENVHLKAISRYFIRRPIHSAETARPLMNGLFALLLFLMLPRPAGVKCGGRTDADVRIVEYRGICDASAASYLDGGRFIVGNDEDNVLRIYEWDEPDPVKTIPLEKFLDLNMDEKNPETDIEASARIGEDIYWISSHGRNREGKIRSNRNRFFAVRISRPGINTGVEPAGRLYKNLLADLLEDPKLAGLGLAETAEPHIMANSGLSPKKRGLNIEGLSRIPGTRSLMIGFRNPTPRGRALLVPFLNPEAVSFAGKKALFSDPVLLNLGGLAVRSIEYVELLNAYLIVAGPSGAGDRFSLFTWSGKPSATPVQLGIDTGWMRKKKFTPESFVVFPETKELLLISDDGTLPVRAPGTTGTCPCKGLKRSEDRRFRGAWLKLVK
jgi:hypothetical protein